MEIAGKIAETLLTNPEVIGLVCTGFAAFLTYIFGKVGNNILKEQTKTQIKEIAIAATHEVLPLAGQLLAAETRDPNTGEVISPAGSRTPDEDARVVEAAKAKMIEIAEKSGVKIRDVVAPEIIHAVIATALAKLEGKELPKASAGVKSLFPILVIAGLAAATLSGCITTGLGGVDRDLRNPVGWAEATPENILAIADHIGEFLGNNSDASVVERQMILTAITYGAADYYFLSKGDVAFDVKVKHAFNAANEYATRNFDTVLKGKRLDIYLAERLGLNERLTEAEYIFGFLKYAVETIKPQ